jgi:hypothetical protein
MRDEKYKQGLYEYAGIGTHRVVLHLNGRWYLAGWEVPLVLDTCNSISTINPSSIGKLLYEVSTDEE